MTVGPEALEPYLRALLDWNQRINLTAVRDLEAARVLHVLDSLAIQDLALDPPPTDCLDLGTGNGFPGVALRLVFPKAKLTLLDRTRKKLRAIEQILTAAGLDGIDTLHLDAEQAPRTNPDLRARFDLITARAVAPPDKLAHLAHPLLSPSGHLVLWLDEQTTAPTRLPGLHLVSTHEYQLPAPAARTRHLAHYVPGPKPPP